MIGRILRILSLLFAPSHDTPVIDHVPVVPPNTINARKFKRLREKAKVAHGKEFKADLCVPRGTAKSDQLKKLEAAAPEVKPAPPENVEPIKKKARP